MLFQSQAAKFVSTALKAAVDQADRQRKERASKLLLMYQGEQEIFIRDNLSRTHKQPERLTPLFVNIVRKVINLKAMVYAQDCRRTIEGTETDQKIFTEIETGSNLAVAMKMCDQLVKLLGTVLLRVVWRGGKIEIDILPGDILDVQTGASPSFLEEVVITHQNEDPSEITYSRWTAELVQKLDYRGQILSQEPNPYGVLPFIPVFSSPPLDDSFWQAGAVDLASIQDAINQILTDALFTARFQSYSLLYIKGAKIEGRKEFTVGPGQVIHLPENGAIGFASPEAHLLESLEAVQTLMRQAAMTNGLSASSVDLKSVAESGRAKLVDNAEIQEARINDQANFRRVEDLLFDLCRRVWNTFNPTRKISETAILWCDFFKPEVLSIYEKIENWRTLLDLRLISPVDVIMEMNPDLSRQAAAEKLRQTQNEIAEFEPHIMPNLKNLFPPIE